MLDCCALCPAKSLLPILWLERSCLPLHGVLSETADTLMMTHRQRIRAVAVLPVQSHWHLHMLEDTASFPAVGVEHTQALVSCIQMRCGVGWRACNVRRTVWGRLQCLNMAAAASLDMHTRRMDGFVGACNICC
mgnify:CR=1 FL=1